jgi:2-hydroxychromene-2-carboxylate isomerase
VTTSFAVTWDYRCPFARNAHEHLVEAMRAGAPWDVRFVPFSLNQVHIEEGEPDIWVRPHEDSGLLAMQAAVVVRDRDPDRFLDLHLALFAARHDHGLKIRDAEVVRETLAAAGIDADAVLAEVDAGEPLETVRREHTQAADEHEVWGVPTFLLGDQAVFVRVMDRPEGDATRARASIDRILALLEEWPELNEFKHTSRKR